MISADPPIDQRAIQHTRVLDLMIVVITAPFWIPVLVALGLLVFITSGGPVLFRQTWVGRDGEIFPMFKFRSMVRGDNPLVPDPTCITPIGRVLRRSSLDELPQIFNVLRGDISLGGPRPMLPAQVAEMSETEKFRHTVRPGLTGLAQVNGRNSLLWDERFSHDLAWAISPQPNTYLHILARTIRVVTGGEGVIGHDSADRFVGLASGEDEPAVVRLIDFDLTCTEEVAAPTSERTT